ncbi:MAG TPA: hypothetical protein VGK80_05160 [Rhodanobacteraceae bacterium]
MGELSTTRRACDAMEGAGIRADGALGVVEWLHLAATPTFAAMALLTVFAGNPADMLCSAHSMSPLIGMTTMYLLMSVLHAGPWLKRVARRRSETRNP